MHAVEKASVNIPAFSNPLTLVIIIIKNNELKALNVVPIIFHIKFFLNPLSFSITSSIFSPVWHNLLSSSYLFLQHFCKSA